MREIGGFFDKLYFSESVLGDAHIDGTQLRIHVSSLFLLAGHPLEPEGYGPYEGELVFEGVINSHRTITEYVGDARKPTGFKPSRQVVDKITCENILQTDVLHDFGFEGYQELPSAWIDNWIVRAKAFVLRV